MPCADVRPIALFHRHAASTVAAITLARMHRPPTLDPEQLAAPEPAPPTRPISPIAWLLPLLWLLLDAAWELSGVLPAPALGPYPIPALVWKGLGYTAAAALLLHFAIHAGRRLRARLRTQNAFLTHPYPMCWIDPATRQIVQANQAASALFGASLQQLRGQPISRFWEPVDSPSDSTSRRRAALPAATTVRVRCGDGRVILMELGILRGNAAAGPGGCLVILREHTGELRAQVESSHRELQALTRRLLHVQEDERRSLSRDLHDDIGQAITAIKLSAHAALEEDDRARRQEDLTAIVELADETIHKLRNLARLLRPPQLDALGLEAALRDHATTLFRTAPDQIALELAIEPLPERPAPEVEQVCFRIAQECLTNALRHAQASRIVLALGDHDGEHLRLRLEDDGRGFDPTKSKGLGLVIMRERAQSVGGALRLDTAPGEGTRICLLLPYTPAQHAQ